MIKDFELITRMWAPLAMEYCKFLGRYNLETVSIVTSKSHLGYEMDIFADGDKYMHLIFTNEKFNKEELQITELLDVIKRLTELFLTTHETKDEYDDWDDEDNYE